MTERIMDVKVNPGGAMEVQVGAPEAPRRATNGPSMMNTEGAVRYEAQSGRMTVERPTKIDGSKSRSGIEGDVMSTVRLPHGSPISDQSQITGECSIEIGGIRTTVDNALRLGYIQRTSQGNYIDSSNERLSQPQESTPTTSNGAPIAGSQVSALIEQGRRQHGAYFDALVSKAVGRIVSGKNGSQVASEFATEVGLDNAQEGVKALETIIHGVQHHAYGIMERHYAIDSGKASDFLNAMDPPAKAQMILRLYHGDVSALRELAERIKLGNKY